jgi:hypothetical protein
MAAQMSKQHQIDGRWLTSASSVAPPALSVEIQAEAGDCFLTTRQLRTRYGGTSEMWVWRRLHHDPDFPHPLVISGRRLWKLSELVAWERKLVMTRAPPSGGARGASLHARKKSLASEGAK